MNIFEVKSLLTLIRQNLTKANAAIKEADSLIYEGVTSLSSDEKNYKVFVDDLSVMLSGFGEFDLAEHVSEKHSIKFKVV